MNQQYVEGVKKWGKVYLMSYGISSPGFILRQSQRKYINYSKNRDKKRSWRDFFDYHVTPYEPLMNMYIILFLVSLYCQHNILVDQFYEFLRGHWVWNNSGMLLAFLKVRDNTW